MVFAGPNPSVGQAAQVTLDGISISCLPGKYEVTEADRFGQKISQGDLSYNDFNPFESSDTISNLTGGAGLRRESDNPIPASSNNPISMYKESSGVNASGYPTVLSLLPSIETLPGATTTPVWSGEFTPSSGALAGVTQFVAVAGTKVYRRVSGSWTDTGIVLAAAALKGAVGAFLGTLIIGYGSAATAQATADLATVTNVQQTTGPTNIYVWAVSTDRAASYVAGGTTISNYNQVMSSTAAASGYGTPIQTGNGIITGLAPGGGLALVFVGKTTELGEIDTGGTYRTLIPFDSSLSTNCNPLRWWMSSGQTLQRGALVLVFPRERGIWTYQPSSQLAGNAYNISPWANPVVRPPNARGLVTAMQGTARWLYYTTTNGSGRTFIWRRDAATGNSHTWVDLGTNGCQTMAITSMFGTNPILFVGYGNSIASITLALDGDNEVDDPACRYVSSGTLDLADIDLGFPDEDKIGFYVHIVADDLVPGAQQISVSAADDNKTFLSLGTVSNSPNGSLMFATYTAVKRLSIRLTLTTTDPTKTPKLLAVSVRLSLNTQLFRLWQFTGTLSAGSSQDFGGDDLRNPQSDISKLWADRAAGVPLQFTDRWNDNYTVRLLRFSEMQSVRNIDKTPETQISCTLLYVASGKGTIVYDSSLAVYDAPTSVYIA